MNVNVFCGAACFFPSPVGSSSALRSRAHSPTIRRSCSPTSRPATSIRRRPMRSWSSCAASRGPARRSWSSPTIAISRVAQTARSRSSMAVSQRSAPVASPRWRKLRGDLRATWDRLVTMQLVIALALAAVGTALGARAVLGREIRASYAATHPADATFELDGDVDDALLAAVRAQPQIAEVDRREMVRARVRLAPSDPWQMLVLFVADDFTALRPLPPPPPPRWPAAPSRPPSPAPPPSGPPSPGPPPPPPPPPARRFPAA